VTVSNPTTSTHLVCGITSLVTGQLLFITTLQFTAGKSNRNITYQLQLLIVILAKCCNLVMCPPPPPITQVTFPTLPNVSVVSHVNFMIRKSWTENMCLCTLFSPEYYQQHK